MKNVFCYLVILSVFFCLSPADAASSGSSDNEAMRVAVVEFDVKGEVDLTDAGSIVAEWMIGAIARTEVFKLQERVLLKKILEEQKLSVSGLVDEKEAAARIGKLFGVQGIVTGSVIKWQDTVSVTARLIDASTGAIIRTAEITTGSMKAVPERINDLALVVAGMKHPDMMSHLDLDQTAAPGKTARQTGGKTWRDPVAAMDFVWIEGGCFQMGQSQEEGRTLAKEVGARVYRKKYDDEFPQHLACVDGFWMGMYEVTNRQFRLYRPEHSSKDFKGKSLNGDEQPVVYVSWDDAKAYAAWLSKAGKGKNAYRLPTEAEWEYACRAGTSSSRFWGEDSDEAGEYANVYDRTAHTIFHFKWQHHDCDDEYPVTSPVGSLYSNDYDLYDMLGNVWEWTEDSYKSDSYWQHQRNNPLFSEEGNRVRRGGSWGSAPGSVRCANRGNRATDRKNKEIGFRLIRVKK